MSTLTLSITKEQFESRVIAALEGAMKSPLVKKKQQIVNSAMVQLLHGGNSAGQNEHNLDMFWNNSIPTGTLTSWIGAENYRHENSFEDDISTVTGSTEDEVKSNLYKSVLNCIADTVSHSITITDLLSEFEKVNSNCGKNYLEKNDLDIESCDEEDIAELLNRAANEPLKTQEAIFEYATNLSSIVGSHSFIECGRCEDQAVVQPEAVTPDITIHSIIVTHKADGEDGDSDNVDVSSTISAAKHDAELLDLFERYVDDENSSFDKDDLINHSVTQDVLSDENMDDSELESMSFEEIINWLKEFGRPNMLVDIIPDAQYGLIEVEVSYTTEAL
ncbi:hypothetical protein LMH73_020190 [Vibrio splendidus]|nr:hypothetical protein [Vibrio splendidus]MCC4882932.1 hypothetical protein [Vibrio splendidus]